jgi:hypothetical protein
MQAKTHSSNLSSSIPILTLLEFELRLTPTNPIENESHAIHVTQNDNNTSSKIKIQKKKGDLEPAMGLLTVHGHAKFFLKKKNTKGIVVFSHLSRGITVHF